MSMQRGPCPAYSKWRTGSGHDCIAVRRSIAEVYLFVVLRWAHAVEINPFSLAKIARAVAGRLQKGLNAYGLGLGLGNEAPSSPGNDGADALKDRLPQREKIDARRPYSARPNSASRWRF